MRALLIAVFVAAFAFAGQAGAHIGKGPQMRPHSQRLTLVQLERRQATSLHRARSVLRFFHSRNLATAARLPRRARASYRWAYAAAEKPGWLVRELGETREAIRARAAPAHLAGWRCITYGAHPGVPGDPHEGHGVSPDGYRGALQMTSTWAGYTRPWESMSDRAVYAVAEKVAAGHGFAYSWMAGQWPRTFPPCAGLFT